MKSAPSFRQGVVVLGLLLVMGAFASFWFERTSDEASPRSEMDTVEEPIAKTPPPPAVEKILPHGALPPLIGPPRGDTRKYCDDEFWAGALPLVREISSSEVVVDETAWERHTSSARTGIASWISKCKLDGDPARIVGDASGELLAVYSSADGFLATR